MLSITQKDETETWCKKDKIRSKKCQFQTPVQPRLSPSCLQEHQTRDPHHFAVAQLLREWFRNLRSYNSHVSNMIFRVLPLTPNRGAKKMFYLKVVMLMYHSIPKTCIYVNVTNCILIGVVQLSMLACPKNRLQCLYCPCRIDRPGSNNCTPLHPKHQTDLLNIDLKGCSKLFEKLFETENLQVM